MKPICQKCHTPLETNAKFCVWCGVRLPESTITPPATSACADEILCANCGKPFYPDSEFCIYCGVKKASAASTAPEALAPAEKTASALVMPNTHTAEPVAEPRASMPTQSTANNFSTADDFDN